MQIMMALFSCSAWTVIFDVQHVSMVSSYVTLDLNVHLSGHGEDVTGP